MRGLKDKVAIVAGAAPGNIRGATESLALHVPLPAELSSALEDRPPPVEVAVYYLICEALTNIAKYARADAGAIRGARRPAARLERSGDGHQSAGRDSAATRTVHWLLRRGTT